MFKRYTPSRRDTVAVSSFGSSHFHVVRTLLATLFLGGVLLSATATENDDRYYKIYGIIEHADELSKGGQADKAKAKYAEAEKALKELKQNYPLYNPKLVNARLTYLANKITALSQPSPTVSTNEPSPATPVAKAAAVDLGQVKLLTPGAEPRTALRFQPQPGDKQVLTLVLKMGMEMPGQGQSPAMNIPALKMKMETQVNSVSDEGDIIYSVAYGELGLDQTAGVAPEMVDAMKKAMGTMKGVTAIGTNTSRGFSKGVKIQTSASANAQTKQALEQMNDALEGFSTPVPEEAVGIGAKWETRMPAKSKGMANDEIIVSELVSLADGRATVKMSLTPRPTNQKTANSAMPLKMDLGKMSGHGEATIDLQHLFPTQATMDANAEMSMGANAGNKKESVSMKMSIHVTLKSE